MSGHVFCMRQPPGKLLHSQMDGKPMLRKASICTLLLQSFFFVAVAGGLQSSDSKPAVGLTVGEAAPSFEARNQAGEQQSLKSIAGKNGTVLLFVRSADW